MTDDGADPELAATLERAIVGAARALQQDQPQLALELIEIVLMGLPDDRASRIPLEIAALPNQILAYARLGQLAGARTALARMEAVVRDHGSDDDRRACALLAGRLVRAELTARARTANDRLIAGQLEAVDELVALAREAQVHREAELAIGVLVVLGTVFEQARPELAREHLERARAVLEELRPFSEAEHARVAGELAHRLAALGA